MFYLLSIAGKGEHESLHNLQCIFKCFRSVNYNDDGSRFVLSGLYVELCQVQK